MPPDFDEHDEEDDQQKLLTALDYQILVLSECGKPIYSSCRHEDELASFFAFIQVLVKRYESWGDDLMSIQSHDVYIQIAVRSPLIVCIVSKHPFNLGIQLDTVFNEIFSVVVRKKLKDRYESTAGNFDLRRWLEGIEKRIEACVRGFNEDPVVFSSGYRILPLDAHDREFIVNSMATSINEAGLTNVAFAILVAHRQLVAIVRMKHLDLSASDFNTIVNLIETHNSLRHIETFVPICLPNFNSSQYFHAYISYLWEGAGPCLIMLSSTADGVFKQLSEVRASIESKFPSYKRNMELKSSLTQPTSFSLKQLSNGELWHFMYKNVQLMQVCCSSPELPFINIKELEIVYQGYFKFADMYSRVNGKVKIFFQQLDTYALFSWITDSFELHCVFSPFVTKKVAWATSEKMLRALRRAEKCVFFTLQPGLLNG
uniref:Vacuolar fusion protein MON1 homolog n=1 Tax=Panagrellus redivivus TaxID=6233 RepID=A0A7E4W0Z3_PANRE